MTFYYETAPLPTPLALYAHRLPSAWHHLESWATLVLELVLPFFIFGPRRARLAAFALFTLFQLCDFATANYGFFCPLAAWLGIFLIGERDLAALQEGPGRAFRFATSGRWLPLRAGRFFATKLEVVRRAHRTLVGYRPAGLTLPPRLGQAVLSVFGGGWALLSAAEGYATFGEPGAWFSRVAPLLEPTAPFRLTNVYHLFASVTRERIEPTFEVRVNGGFRELALRYKPGPPDRPPPFVAPHQPRVDFQLWFHGLAPQRQPAYLARLLGALCEEPSRVSWLFETPWPSPVTAVRVSYYRLHFAEGALDAARSAGDASAERGRWWTRELVDRGQLIPCHAGTSNEPPAMR